MSQNDICCLCNRPMHLIEMLGKYVCLSEICNPEDYYKIPHNLIDTGISYQYNIKAGENDCKHLNMGVKFDEEAARGLEAEEVRKRWPRGWNVTCPDCKQNFGIAYASYMHYIMGDW